MKQNKQRALVVCPGRGTYNKAELGYFGRYHADKQAFIDHIDAYRRARGQIAIQELDQAAAYNTRLHTAGENASALIYACAAADFAAIDTDQYDIVAVTGNSMGWYIAMAVANALSDDSAIAVINTMGSMMTDGVIGGQMIYPVVDEQWHIDKVRCQQVLTAVESINQKDGHALHLSILLGGYYVLGGNDAGLDALKSALPPIDDTYPMRLFNHAAFHTPLLNDVSAHAKQQLGISLFGAPSVPLIDGQGSIWQPMSSDVHALRDYTLGHQVTQPYDFSKAIEVGLKEFAPDKVIVLGPGATLGGAIAQEMIRHCWEGLQRKDDFIQRQKQDPYLLSMGIDAQRAKVVGC